MLKVIIVAALLGSLLLVVHSRNDDELDRCERAGEEGGRLASRGACAILTTTCPPLKEAAAQEETERFERSAVGDLAGGIPEKLVVQLKRDTCVTLFQTKCRATASAFVFAGSGDPVCADILTRGPTPVPGCEDHEAAVGIFDKALELCDQEPGSSDQVSVPDKPARGATFEDPCECTTDGYSGKVQTSQVGCKKHIFNNPRQFCYVAGGSACEGGSKSNLFDGAYWRDC
ncbi:hypothetical protein BSKO_13962 [Bryopsis sp. KO-2023]|nr:hypothetical protein BSKO_13962 [Bryopsis sp. KO-2023]